MFNIQIFKKDARSNWVLWLVLMLVPAIIICMMFGLAETMETSQIKNLIIQWNASPTNAGKQVDLSNYMNNADFVKMMMPRVTGIVMPLTQGVFGSLGFELPLIYVVVASNKLVAGQVQNGHITYTIASPVSRREIILTKMSGMLISLLSGFVLILLITIPFYEVFKGHIENYLTLGQYIRMLFGLFVLLLTVSSISFFASTLFNKSVWSFVLGAGLPIFFFMINLLSGLIDDIRFLKYISINTLFTETISSPSYSLSKWVSFYIVLLLMGGGFYTAGSIIFCKKDLPL